MIKIKEGVGLLGISPIMSLVPGIVDGVLDQFSVDTVVTSCSEGGHGKSSSHFRGHALDFRSRDLDVLDVPIVAMKIQAALGGEFQVITESDHFHIQYRPLKGLNQ